MAPSSLAVSRQRSDAPGEGQWDLTVSLHIRRERVTTVQGFAIVNVVNDLTTLASADPVSLANELRPVLVKLSRHLRREVHSLGVTGGQVSLLAQIRRNPGIGVRELADLEGMSAPAMSGYVRRLERAGLLERVEGEDRRRVGLHVTAEAERVLRSVRSRRTAWLSARLERLDPPELRRVEAAVGPLTALLDEDE